MIRNTEAVVNGLTIHLPFYHPLVPLVPGTKRASAKGWQRDGSIPADKWEEMRLPKRNYGIRLDDLVCVDFDQLDFTGAPEVAAFYAQCVNAGTWKQRTGGEHQGVHFLFASPQVATQVTKIRSISGLVFGEIKSGRGMYIVGPGSFVKSEYVLENGVRPLPIPPYVQRWTAPEPKKEKESKGIRLGDLDKNPGVEAIPKGSHHAALLEVSLGFVRAGLTRDRAAAFTALAVQQGLLKDYDEAEPFAEKDFADLTKNLDPGIVEEEKPPAKIYTRKYIAANPKPPVHHYVNELRLRVGGGPMLLTGNSGSKKTALILHIGQCLENGTPVFGKYAVVKQPKHVLFVSIDMPEDDAWRRVGCLPGTPTDNFLFVDYSSRGFDGAAFAELLSKYPESYVLVDCYADIASGETVRINDYEGLAARSLINNIKQAFQDADCDGIITDHTTRPNTTNPKASTDNFIGSAQKRASFRQGLTIRAYTESEMKRIKAPILNEANEPVTYSIIENLKPGESGKVLPIHVAFVENILVGSQGEILGAQHTPKVVMPPEPEPQPEPTGNTIANLGSPTRKSILKNAMTPGQQYTTAELEKLTRISQGNIPKIIGDDAAFTKTRMEHSRAYIYALNELAP